MKPQPLETAINYILNKTPDPAWNPDTWRKEGKAVDVAAFISSRVDSVRFLDRAQGLMFDYLAETRDDVVTRKGERTDVKRVGGRGDFVRKMREFMVKEGMISEDELDQVDQNDIQQLSSERRLNLIFDTNIRQAVAYGKWKQGMEPLVRAKWPAARVIRVRGVQIPRPRHERELGTVKLKGDPWWADWMNDPKIGGFAVPWGPYGFGSGVEQEEVSQKDWEQLNPYSKARGRKQQDTDENAKTADSDFNANRKFDISKIDPALRDRLLKEVNSKGAERAKIVEENNALWLKLQQEGRGLTGE